MIGVWCWALAYNWRRNLRLIDRYGLVLWHTNGPRPRHAAPGRARRRRYRRAHAGPLYSVPYVLRLAGVQPLG